MSNSPVVTKSSFPIVLLAALKHPDADLRKRLEKSIDDWISNKGKKVPEKDLKNSFDQCKGTVLEPFYIKGLHLKASTMLSQLAFSDAHQVNLVRILSEDAFGTNYGGCVIRKDLTTSFSSIYKKNNDLLKLQNNTWSYCPWKIPTSKNTLLKTVLKIVDNGYQIIIKVKDWDLFNWDYQNNSNLCRNLENESKLILNNKNLNELGCRVGFQDHSIIIETINTDHMLKLSAYLIQGETLILDPGTTYIDRNCIAIKFKHPDQAQIDLFSTLGLRTTDLGGWIRTNCKDGPTLNDEDKIEILKFTTPPIEWITPSFMEQL